MNNMFADKTAKPKTLETIKAIWGSGKRSIKILSRKLKTFITDFRIEKISRLSRKNIAVIGASTA